MVDAINIKVENRELMSGVMNYENYFEIIREAAVYENSQLGNGMYRENACRSICTIANQKLGYDEFCKLIDKIMIGFLNGKEIEGCMLYSICVAVDATKDQASWIYIAKKLEETKAYAVMRKNNGVFQELNRRFLFHVVLEKWMSLDENLDPAMLSIGGSWKFVYDPVVIDDKLLKQIRGLAEFTGRNMKPKMAAEIICSLSKVKKIGDDERMEWLRLLQDNVVEDWNLLIIEASEKTKKIQESEEMFFCNMLSEIGNFKTNLFRFSNGPEERAADIIRVMNFNENKIKWVLQMRERAGIMGPFNFKLFEVLCNEEHINEPWWQKVKLMTAVNTLGQQEKITSAL